MRVPACRAGVLGLPHVEHQLHRPAHALRVLPRSPPQPGPGTPPHLAIPLLLTENSSYQLLCTTLYMTFFGNATVGVPEENLSGKGRGPPQVSSSPLPKAARTHSWEQAHPTPQQPLPHQRRHSQVSAGPLSSIQPTSQLACLPDWWCTLYDPGTLETGSRPLGTSVCSFPCVLQARASRQLVQKVHVLSV